MDIGSGPRTSSSRPSTTLEVLLPSVALAPTLVAIKTDTRSHAGSAEHELLEELPVVGILNSTEQREPTGLMGWMKEASGCFQNEKSFAFVHLGSSENGLSGVQ